MTTGTRTPNWIMPIQILTLDLGHSSFTCCETNHTLIKTCRRPRVMKMLRDEVIRARVELLFQYERRYPEARFTLCLTSWWLRSFNEFTVSVRTLSEFKKKVRLDHESNQWFDKCNFCILAYAVMFNCTEIVHEILRLLKGKSRKMRQRCVNSRTPTSITDFGITHGMPLLLLALGFASPEIVFLLTESGANPYVTGSGGSDALMIACLLNRVDNIDIWLRTFPNWKINKRSSMIGSSALIYGMCKSSSLSLSLSLAYIRTYIHT